MILVDSSVWIDHFRKPIPHLQALVSSDRVCCHPFVTGELIAGAIHIHHPAIFLLRRLPQLGIAEEEQFFGFIERHELNGLGLGFVDLHLLMAAASTPDHELWSRDGRLAKQAERLAVDYRPD